MNLDFLPALVCALGTAMPSTAPPTACPIFRGLYGETLEDCVCEATALAEIGMESLSAGMHPAAACGYSVSRYESGASEIHGLFFYRGKDIIHGHVRLFANEVLSDTLEFGGGTFAPRGALGVSASRFRFGDQERALEQLRVPMLDKRVQCREAEATVTVEELLFLPGGTDESGLYATRYHVVATSPFIACEADQ